MRHVNSLGGLSRRQLLWYGLWLPAARASAGTALPPSVIAPRPLVFPADHGSHNAARTEWWYLTGQLESPDQHLWGFQVTFFRSRVDGTQQMRSRLAARQLLFAHAALTDVDGKRHWHDQLTARWNGETAPSKGPTPLTSAASHDTGIQLSRWRLERQGSGHYQTTVHAREFALELQAEPTQNLLLQGERGWSRKGPDRAQASHYYSQPQLRMSGQMTVQGRTLTVSGKAWLDHEWSEALLHPEAVGWDWIGMNLDDGASLTAFQLRRADGSTIWAGGSFRSGQNRNRLVPDQVFQPQEVVFSPTRHWISPRSDVRYPVAWEVKTPAGHFVVQALVDDQELDSSRSTGAIYWEGISELLDAKTSRRLGRGYLELTGYGRQLHL